MQTYDPTDAVNRLAKQMVDSGRAGDFAEAENLLGSYRLTLQIEDSEANDAADQAALLTAVALGRRVFLGGVTVVGSIDVPHLTRLPLQGSLKDAVRALGGITEDDAHDAPVIHIGGPARDKRQSFQVRTAAAGWRGGILPAHSDEAITGKETTPPAAMLSAALAVNEVFLHLNSDMPAAGRRTVGMSLWQPHAKVSWLTEAADEPDLYYLPSNVWIIGLGHLGQAFLWALGLLNYQSPPELKLVLQDTDIITPSTESTSILSGPGQIGVKKTRAMADWAERRGFSTSIHERLFDDNYRRQPDEPAVAFCGLDNAVGRRALENAGFDFIVEAGLGNGHRDFRNIRLHTLPGPKRAVDLWKPTAPREQTLQHTPAYQKLLSDGTLDQCGITLLAGKAVGAPFVGMVAAALSVSELLRVLHGGAVHHLVDLDLMALEHRQVVLSPIDFSKLNPGYTLSGD